MPRQGIAPTCTSEDDGKYPVVLIQTPYNKMESSGLDGRSRVCAVVALCRCELCIRDHGLARQIRVTEAQASGTQPNMAKTARHHRWIVKQPWSNGKSALGMSALGKCSTTPREPIAESRRRVPS